MSVFEQAKLAGEQLERLIQEHPMPIMVIDAEGVMIDANPRYLELFAGTRPPAGYNAFRNPIVRRLFDDQIIADIEAGRPVTIPEVFYNPSRVNPAWPDLDLCFTLHVRALRGADGAPERFLALYEDLSELKRLEQSQLREQALESLGTLAAGIAHDFNNDLTSLLGYASLAADLCAEGHPARGILERMRAIARRSSHLTAQLLTFARGGEPVRLRQRIGALIEETATFAHRGQPTTLLLEVEPDLWAADVDSGQLRQVLVNLLLNAQQATRGCGTITVRARNLPAEQAAGVAALTHADNYLQIEVSDTGCGMSAEVLDRAREPFFTTREGGTGLGLATAHSIVRKHWGQLHLDSEPGRGTRVGVFLPALPFVSTAEEVEIGDAIYRGHGQVLLVDDDPEIRRSAAAMLTHLGYEARAVESGERALELLAESQAGPAPIEVAIVDLTLSTGASGETIGAAMRARWPALRLIAASGYTERSIIADPAAHGFDAALPKPYSLEDLSRAVFQQIFPEGDRPPLRASS